MDSAISTLHHVGKGVLHAAEIVSRARAVGLAPEHLTVRSAQPREVAGFLSLAEAGLCFVKPCPSKQASSPTKVAEYLAAGLPVVATADVGDTDALIRENRVGVLLRSSEPVEVARAWEALRELLRDEGLPARCRQVAEERLDVQQGVEAYAAVYQRVLARR